MENRALIFLNGNLADLEYAKKLIDKKTYLIGCDGGADAIYKLGYKPHAVVGDFDSMKKIPAEIKKLKLEKRDSELLIGKTIYRKYSRDKDFLDSELAIDFAAEKDFKEIILVNHLGNKIDHMLGTILSLGKAKYARLNIKIVQPLQEIFVASGRVELNGKPGQKISFIPLFGEVEVSSSHGLRYDPSEYKMTVETNMGISNEFEGMFAALNITAGKFLVIRQLDIING